MAKKVFLWLKFFRANNLFLLALLLFWFYFRLYTPFLTFFEMLFIAATNVLTAAYGNAVNDLYDKENDAANGEEKLLTVYPENFRLAKKIVTGMSWLIVVFGAISLLLFPFFALVIFFSLGALYAYSAANFLHLKSVPLAGNFVVALLTTLSLVSCGICTGVFGHVVWLWGFLTFFLGFAREIVKDCQDAEGDGGCGVRTVATVWGFNFARRVVLALSLCILLTVFWGFHREILTLEAFLFCVFAVFFLGMMTLRAETKKDFGRVSTGQKMLMFAAIFLL
jgi:4-hydroxybenzoate polyprenyltransferase